MASSRPHPAPFSAEPELDFSSPEERRRAAVDRAVLDLEHLDRYTMGDKALEQELLSLFRMQARQYADRLNDIVDPADWRLATHSIKGAARCIGAGRVATAAQALEETDPFTNPDRRRTLTQELLSHIVDCETTIEALAG